MTATTELPARPRPPLTGPLRRVRAGQIAAAQVALALPVAAAGRGALAVAGAGIVASALVLAAWLPVRRRWLFEWAGVALGYLARRHTLPPGTPPSELLDFVAPGAALLPAELAGEAAAVIGDNFGLAAVLDLGDPDVLLAETGLTLPGPAALVPAAGPEMPPVRVQLLLTGAPPAATGGPATMSYRQLAEGRLLRYERAVLAVRVLRADGWSEGDLCRALSSAVRKVCRRLGPVIARPLGPDAALRVFAELAHHETGQPVRESWPVLRLGGLPQSTFRLRRWPDATAELGRSLVPRLLRLPAVATTVSLSAGPCGPDGTLVPADLTVRLAAASPAALAGAAQELRRLVAAAGGELRRLDGEQVPGLAATLPLGGPPVTSAAPAPALPLDGLPVGTAGLMIGTNRHGGPMAVRLFRPEPTRVLLVGGVRLAQLVTLRAMALGARVVVQTVRPRDWEPLVRAVAVPGAGITVTSPGRPVGGPAGAPLRPLLLVTDGGSVPHEPDDADRGWRTTLIVRDELATVDGDVLARADLAIMQALRPDEAAVAGTALGLGDSADLLTRIGGNMVAVVHRRAVRWARLSPTPVEHQLVGPPVRH